MRLVRTLLWIGLTAWACLTAGYFPYTTDAPPTPEETARTIDYYQRAYSEEPASGEDYVKVAEDAAAASGVKATLEQFVRANGFSGKRALDVGSGRGYLQDVVENYTGLDISPSARRFYHKNFVLGSATAMPFPDNQYDLVWSIWVLEHVPNPEQALREMRRVVKDGGILYLMPAWSCPDWAGGGYSVRPYSDFGVAGKFLKATVPVRADPYFVAAYIVPTRAMRFAAYKFGPPTRLHYRRLTPNYQKYWMPDSDAVSSIDWQEAALWFTSRGDEVLNHDTSAASIVARIGDPRLIVRVHKH